MSKWSKLYEKEIKETSVSSYIEEKLRTKNRVINLINTYATNKQVMELSVGTGILALKISSMGNKDIRDYKVRKKIDVIYSIGILEHYNDEDKKMYGNERYLSIRYWRELINKSNGELIDETHYHYLNWYQRIFKISKYFKPYPVHVFVLKNK